MGTTPKTPPKWTDLSRSDFDREAPLTLFEPEVLGAATGPRKADKCGTPDLFSMLEER